MVEPKWIILGDVDKKHLWEFLSTLLTTLSKIGDFLFTVTRGIFRGVKVRLSNLRTDVCYTIILPWKKEQLQEINKL